MALPTSKIAAGAALAGLGALGGAAVAPQPERPTTTKVSAPAPPEVRTEVIHRTIHVYKHPKKRHAQPAAAAPAPAAAAPAPVAAAAATTTPSSGYARPLSSHTSGAATAPVTHRPLTSHTSGAVRAPTTHKPLTTRTSGSGSRGTGGGEREHESERGDD